MELPLNLFEFCSISPTKKCSVIFYYKVYLENLSKVVWFIAATALATVCLLIDWIFIYKNTSHIVMLISYRSKGSTPNQVI